jgi:hypothetical protein
MPCSAAWATRSRLTSRERAARSLGARRPSIAVTSAANSAAADDTRDRPSSVSLTSTARRSAADGARSTRPRRSFQEPPHYQPFEAPVPSEGEVLADVLAAGLHPRVRTGAAGRHYTSSGTLPMIPGIDGVGRLPDGRPVYFASDDDVMGTMADKALVDPRRSVELPAGVDVAKVAAAMNPAMSSWVALRRRVPLKPGQGVLVLGATGNAGALAVRVARRLGAGRVVGAGRDPGRAIRPGPRGRRRGRAADRRRGRDRRSAGRRGGRCRHRH